MPLRPLSRCALGVLLAPLAVAACTARAVDELAPPEPELALYALVSTLDGVSLYPPLAPAPSASGAFDPSLLGELSVVLEATAGAGPTRAIARFDASSQPLLRLVAEHEVYFVDVPAATYFTDPSSAYRFRVLFRGVELARSDLSEQVFAVLAKRPQLLVGVKVRIERRAAPTLSSVEPALVEVGAADTALTLRGASFTSDAVVTADGVTLETTRRTPELLIATLPAGMLTEARTRLVGVTVPAPGGGASASLPVVVENRTPVATALVPASVTAESGAFTLTVLGAVFASGASISLDGRPLETTWISGGELRAPVPGVAIAAAGVSSVVVTNPAPSRAPSAALGLTVNNPTPILSALDPDTVASDAGDVALTLRGGSFVPGVVASYDGVPLATSYVASGELRATLPASRLGAVGGHAVTAVNPTPNVGASAARTFTVAHPAPAITGLAPASVLAGSGGFVLTVTGRAFVDGAVVSLGGARLTTTYASSTSLLATVPAARVTAAATLDVGVSNPTPQLGGDAHASFSVLPAPGLTITTARNLSTDALTAGRTCAEAYAASVVGLSATSATLSAAPAAGCFVVGDIVLLINLQGAAGATTNVGVFEALTVGGVSGATISFQSAKTRWYGSGPGSDAAIGTGAGQQKVVLQRVPVFGDVTVGATGSLTASAWDGSRYGVLAFRAGRLTVNGAITMVAKGYRTGTWSRDDGSCSDSLATGRGESIDGPSVITTAASFGGGGGISAGSAGYNGNTPLNASGGHGSAGEPGQNPRGRVLGPPGGTYGANDGSLLTLGSGSGGNVTCEPGSFSPYLVSGGNEAGGAIALWADTITVATGGTINANAGDGTRSPGSGGYVLLRANSLSLGTGVSARGANGASQSYTNHGGSGYVALYHRDPLSGSTTPAAYDRTTATPFDP